MRSYVDRPKQIGEHFTITDLDDSESEYVVTAVERSTIFGSDDNGWIEESQLVLGPGL
jgi:hypothetical protein